MEVSGIVAKLLLKYNVEKFELYDSNGTRFKPGICTVSFDITPRMCSSIFDIVTKAEGININYQPVVKGNSNSLTL